MDQIINRISARRGAASQIFDQLRDDIITLKARPGSVLSRTELQERFALSSTPVRDALLRLQEEGLVDIFPQHATIVAPIDLDRAREGQFLRRSVELEVVRTLADAPPAPLITHLRALIRQQAVYAAADDTAAFTASDHAFHRAMFVGAGVADLWRLVRRHGGHIDRLRMLHLPVAGKMQEIVAAHSAIVDAIETGSGTGAQAAMSDHLSRSLQSFELLKQQHPSYFR